MSDLTRLEELDPELAAWWRERRREAWREVGLVRPRSAAEQLADIARAANMASSAIRAAWKRVTTALKPIASKIQQESKER